MSGTETEPGASPPPSTPPAAVTLEPTLLIQVTTADGAAGNMLTGVIDDPEPAASLVLLPANLVVASRTAAPRPIRETVLGIDTLRPLETVAETLGVRVDASWRMDRKALAGLVDAFGGVAVAPEVRTVIRDGDGDVVLRLKPGRQTLSGSAASWYAVGPVRGETVDGAVARFRRVMIAVLSQLPADESAIREALTALGSLSPATISTTDLSAYLLDLTAALGTGDFSDDSLPVSVIGSGAGALAWTDYTAATPLLRQRMPWAQWSAGIDGPPRVLVQAPEQPPGLILSARQPLLDQGLVWVDGRGTDVGSPDRSTVRFRPPRSRGLEVAAALELPMRSLRPPDTLGPVVLGRPWADIDVVLARDYRP